MLKIKFLGVNENGEHIELEATSYLEAFSELQQEIEKRILDGYDYIDSEWKVVFRITGSRW